MAEENNTFFDKTKAFNTQTQTSQTRKLEKDRSLKTKTLRIGVNIICGDIFPRDNIIKATFSSNQK